MLVTPEFDRNNRRYAAATSVLFALSAAVLGWFYTPLFTVAALAPLGYWLIRRRCLRRLAVARRPFPREWQAVLESRVHFYRTLGDAQKQRFRELVAVFLDEVAVTGVQTEVDDAIRVLVAASAIIPVFGFEDWEYHRLAEVLVYPGSFDETYRTNNAAANVLGLTGLGHLRGVVILSKPSLLAGFSHHAGKENVGIHEFAHLIEQEEVDRGLPPEVSPVVVRQWVEYVGRELAHPSNRKSGIKDYAYTNEHEFFAVLSEYFFESPVRLKAKAPGLYEMLRRLFHQDPVAFSGHLPRLRRRKNSRRPGAIPSEQA